MEVIFRRQKENAPGSKRPASKVFAIILHLRNYEEGWNVVDAVHHGQSDVDRTVARFIVAIYLEY